jgi:DNA-binding transcriptional ArsR family regulator
MEPRRDVFQAIADPTRREIIGLLAHHRLNLNAIAERFDVTRQAVSLHVKILAECGLIVISQKGRERICEIRLEKLGEVNEWICQYRVFWAKKLHTLKIFVEQEPGSGKVSAKKNISIPKKTKRK